MDEFIMSLDNVLQRYCDPSDFYNSYKSLCGLQDSVPVNLVKAHYKNYRLELNADKVRVFDWAPIINAIKFDKSLEALSVFSIYKHQLRTRRKTLRFKMNCPPVHTKDVVKKLALSVSFLLKKSSKITTLELQGVPFTERDLFTIAKGVSKNTSLTTFTLDYCPVSEKCAKSLCNSFQKHPKISHISLSGCNLTSSSANEVCKLLHNQSLGLHSKRWVESLRYRTPDLKQMGGIKRLTLNANPAIGDDGISLLCEILPQDLWVKAIDLQGCGLSEKGASLLYSSIQMNNSIVVLDIRNNPMISNAKIREVLASVLLNAAKIEEAEYPWIKHKFPKLDHKTNIKRKPNVRTHTTFMPSVVEMKSRNSLKSHNVSLSFQKNVSSVKRNGSKLNKKPKSANPFDNFCVYKSRKCNQYFKDVQSLLGDMQRKLERANELEKTLKDMIINLEAENYELKLQLTDAQENMSVKSKLQDETLLENVEESFNKFHDFLDKLHEAGLGSIIEKSGYKKGMKVGDSNKEELALNNENDENIEPLAVEKSEEEHKENSVSSVSIAKSQKSNSTENSLRKSNGLLSEVCFDLPEAVHNDQNILSIDDLVAIKDGSGSDKSNSKEVSLSSKENSFSLSESLAKSCNFVKSPASSQKS